MLYALVAKWPLIVFSCVIKAILLEAGLDFSNENITAAVPSCTVLPDLLDEHSAEIRAILQKMIKGKKIYGNFDRANKGIHHMIKGISFWYVDSVYTFLLDNEASLGNNLNGSKAINLRLKNVNYIGVPKTCLNGQSTDGGRGITQMGLAHQIYSLS